MSRTEQIKSTRNGKPVTIEYRIADSRKLRRAALKAAQGNNRIGPAWRTAQVKAHPAMRKLYALAAMFGGGRRQRLLDQISRGCA